MTDANYWDPVLNRSYHALGRHYNVAIVPARVRRPRDKPTAENAVRLVEMWVLAPLRHRQFFSLAEANAALAEKIEEWNNRPFAPPREGSRRSLFEAIERDKLKPLPAAPFVVGQWLVARVNIDYHIAVDGHFYSVPYRLVHQRLDVFLTATAVAIFHHGERVTSPKRLSISSAARQMSISGITGRNSECAIRERLTNAGDTRERVARAECRRYRPPGCRQPTSANGAGG